MSKTSLASRILENAQTITKLNHKITQSHENKDKDLKSWQEVCHVFNTSYNQLAFPSGLSEGLNAPKKHDPDTIEVAIEYLNVDPYYFRSGYNKKKIVHLLKSAPLKKKQIKTLQEILFKALKSKYVLYMEYCRLARKIQDLEFKEKLEAFAAQSTNQRKINRAQKMLRSMNS